MMISDISHSESESDLGYGKLLAILLRRRVWWLTLLVMAMAGAGVITWKTEPTYKSQMQLLVEPNYPARQPSSLEEDPLTQTTEEDYATQLALMRSSQFTEKAAALLHPTYPLIEATDIEKNLSLSQLEEGDIQTRIFAAAYVDNDPQKTQDVLIALQKVYQDYNRQQDQQRLQQGLGFINQGLPDAEKKLLQAEGSLEQFRETQNVIDPLQQAETVSEQLNTVKKERFTLDTQIQSVQARYNALEQQLSRSPDEALVAARLSESSRYQDLLNQLQTTELAIAQQRTIFTDADPEVKILLEQRQSELSLLRQEVARVLGTFPTQLQVTPEELLKQGQLSKLDLNLAQQLAETQTELATLSSQQQGLAQTEATLEAQLQQFPRLIAQYNQLQPEVEIQRQTIGQLLQKRQELSLEIVRGGFNWQVVEPPLLGEQIAPSLKKNLALGMVVGMFLGGMAAFAREGMDQKIHSVEDMQGGSKLPLLGNLPLIPRAKVRSFRLKSKPAEDAILQAISGLGLREALDLTHKNIHLAASSNVLKSVLITSALPQEGKSLLSVGLALSGARLHQRVLLIDANFRHPNLHQILHLPNQSGLSTVLSGEASSPLIHSLSILGSDLDILTAGDSIDDPVKLLSSQKWQELMAEFEHQYDWILVDAAPILGTVDVLQTASACQAGVVVARLEQIAQTELSQALGMLSHFNILGLVANGGDGQPTHYFKHSKQPNFQRNGLPPDQKHRLLETRHSGRN
ncbi:MAG: polysaccharide biosynthesis tyrosine autokinase [Microcoleaceae cyanobacterium]